MNNEASQKTNTDTMPTTGNVKVRLKIRITRNYLLVIVIIIAVIIGVFAYHQRLKSPKISPFDSAFNIAITEGKYAQGQKILDAEIKKSSNNQTAANLYLQKATIAINAKQLTDAMHFAKKADGLVPSSMSANMIADIASYQGNKAMAIQWLNTTIQRLDKNSQGYQIDLQDIKQKINDMSQ